MEDFEEEEKVEKKIDMNDNKIDFFEKLSQLQKLIKEESTLGNLCK